MFFWNWPFCSYSALAPTCRLRYAKFQPFPLPPNHAVTFLLSPSMIKLQPHIPSIQIQFIFILHPPTTKSIVFNLLLLLLLGMIGLEKKKGWNPRGSRSCVALCQVAIGGREVVWLFSLPAPTEKLLLVVLKIKEVSHIGAYEGFSFSLDIATLTGACSL